MRRRATWTGVAMAVVAGGCGAVPGSVGHQGAHLPHHALPAGSGAAAAGPIALTAYDSCDQLLASVRAQALAAVGPYGLPSAAGGVAGVPGTVGGNGGEGFVNAAAAPSAAAAASSTTTAGAMGTAGGSGGGADAPLQPAFSTTNVQEAGVDEPDLVKTDGHLLVVVRQGASSLQVADVGGSPRLRGSLSLSALGAPAGMFLVGSRAVVLLQGSPTPPSTSTLPSTSSPSTPPITSTTSTTSSSPGSPGTAPGGLPTDVSPVGSYTPATVVAVVSLADPDHPVLERSFTLQGSEVDARLLGGHVEVVVTSSPQLPFVVPSSASATATGDALAANRALVATAPVSDWLPAVTSSSSPGST
ncbi:MAG TPA: beta-propeller domain-containing protein, partial [Acidimicrobiales bacterium]|nr:beta-propeller domain-containing protein [Acidimicrobiales bacterium]